MRRTQRIYLASLLSALGAGQAMAQSGPLDARAVRPAVMLLVDTSGSMERVPDDGSNPDCDSCVPTCTGDTALDSLQKTRWAMTVEALTGTIQGYKCVSEDRSSYASTEYDYGYYLPHINFTQNISQASDGILDSFANRVKFGLMTFDGVGTTLGGPTLVPMTDWLNTTGPFVTAANGAPGMFSYGRVGRLSFPGCEFDYGVNAGARGPNTGSDTHPGAFLRVGASDNQDDILAVNSQIQQSLLQVHPFGGTPIAAMLDDLKYYLDGSDTSSDLSRAADTLYNCRRRVAILITDGAPDALFRDSRFQCDNTNQNSNCALNSSDTTITNKKCECPYEAAETLAHQLIDAPNNFLDQLIVVAYNVHDPVALGILNGIGANGSSSPVSDSPDYPYLVQADGPTELRDRLDDLLNAYQPGVTSRSVPISVTTGSAALGPNSKRFDITAGFQMGRNEDEPWNGLLYRHRVECEGTSVNEDLAFDASQGDVFNVSLDDQARAGQRKLFTAVPRLLGDVNGTLVNGGYAPVAVFTSPSGDPAPETYYDNQRLPLTLNVRNVLKPDGSNFVVGLLPDLNVTTSIDPHAAFDNSLSSLYFGDANRDNLAGQPADRSLIIDFVNGVTRQHALGDIYHSNPVALPPLNRFSTDRFADLNSTYASWLKSIIAAGGGAHYGTDGRPGIVFVGSNDGVLHAFNLDTWKGTTGSEHPGGEELWGFIPPVLFSKMASTLGGHQFMFDGTPVVKDVILQKRPDHAPIFRTVLVSAVRGAPAFVALDVTHPELPVFLWQTTFPDAGNTIANVAVTQVEVNWRGENQIRAVAILPGGEGSQANSCPLLGHTLVDGETRAKYPTTNNRNVRCWNTRGRGLYVVDVATGDLIQEFGSDHFPSPLTGSVVVDGEGVDPSAAAYFFDHDGVLWRLSMLSTNPSEWRAAPVYDMFASPLAASDGSASWKVGRRPTYAPTLTRDNYGNLVILAGTGDVDSPTDTARHRVVSLTELRSAADSNSSGAIEAEIHLNWQIDLAQNEAVTGPLTVFDRNVYWSSFENTSGGANQCALGQSRIWGVHSYLPDGTTATPPVPKPVLTAINASATDPKVPSVLLDSQGNNLLIGLTVARQPICQAAVLLNPVTNHLAPTAPPGGGVYTLKGMLAGSSSGGSTVTGSQLKTYTGPTLPSESHANISSWASFVE